MINTKIKQAHTSSNMFDWRAEGAIYNSVYTQSRGWQTHYYMYMTPLIAVKGGGTYTWRISADTSSGSSRLTDITTVYYDKDLNEIGYASHDDSVRYYSFTVPQNCAYVRCPTSEVDEVYRESMLNVGSSPLPYEEYYAPYYDTVSYAKSITDSQTYTKFPIILRTTEQSISTWSVKGNMSQSATPTPTSPITPQECGDMTENYFDIQNYVANITTHNCTVSVAANGVKITATGSDAYAGEAYKLPDRANAADRAAAIPATENTTYVLSADVDSFRDCYISYLDSSYYAINTNYTGIGANVPATFTTPAGTAYISFRFGSTSLSSGQSKTFANLTLTKNGKYKLPIVNGNTTTNVYLNEPLRKIGNYADTIAADGTVTRNIKKLVLTGDENWYFVNALIATNAFYRLKLSDGQTVIPTYIDKCTHYEGKQIDGNSATGIGYCVQYISNSDISCIQIRPYEETTYGKLNTFKTYLADQYAAGTPVIVWYVLATPTTESITMPTIPTTSGLNTVDVNTTLKPSEMSLTYDGYKLCKGQRYSRTENLFDGNLEQGSFNADGSETTWSDITYRVRSTFFGELSSGTYTINCSGADDVVVNVYETSDTSTFKSDESVVSWQSMPYTLTLAANRFVRFAFRKSDNSDIAPSEISNLMLNTGSTAKPYQPYLDWE